jgi:NIPSNAP
VIYDLRIYDAMPGKLPALNKRFETITLAYFEKYNMKVVGFWTDVIGISARLNHMLAFDDLGHREKAWAAFVTDSERQKAFAETERGGPLVAKVENKILQPTVYSPLK